MSLLFEGKTIALISDAGMPCISDPGFILVKKCYEAGIEVRVVPGANAAVSAAAISGIEAARFLFEGFLPVEKKERAERLDEIKELSHALIFYEAPHKLKKTLFDLCEVLGGERRAAVCRELTKLYEQTLRGTLSELSEYFDKNEPRGEIVIIVEGKKREKNPASAQDAAKLAQKLISRGQKLSEACKQAAKQTGASKREIYNILLEEQEKN